MSSLNRGPRPYSASVALRKRVAFELATLTVLTPIFLYYVPRGGGLYAAAALLLLTFIAVTAADTRVRVWGRPGSRNLGRLSHATVAMLTLTMPVVALFFAWCVWRGHHVSYVNLLLALCIYLPWALLQQTIFQFYLLGRLRVLLPLASPTLLAAINGVAYGLVHLPNQQVTMLTIIGGTFWSYSYLRDRQIWPIAISHAVVGTTFYYFVSARDLYSELLAHLTHMF